jgi:hypothetical protein
MNGGNNQGGGWVATLLPIVIIAVVFFLRYRSIGKERPLNLGFLWVVPLIFMVLAATMFIELPPPPLGWTLTAVGLAVGVGLGWYRGKLIHIDKREDGKLFQKASPLAFFLLLALFAIKFSARELFGTSSSGDPASAPMLMTDAFMGFAFGLLSATRVEIFLRAKRILASA